MKKLAHQLKVARKHSGFSVREVQSQLKINNISRYENAQTAPKFCTVVKMARLYGVDILTFAGVVK